MRSYESSIEWNVNPAYQTHQSTRNASVSCGVLPTISKNERASMRESEDVCVERGVTISAFEKEILAELNSCRTNPRAYASRINRLRKSYKKNFIQESGEIPIRTIEGKIGLDEAVQFLSEQKSLHPLQISRGLLLSAQDHVADSCFSGVIGELGSDLTTPTDRAKRYGQCGLILESEAYARFDPLQFVVQMIVDDGNLSRPNRVKIFDEKMTMCGIAVGQHPKEVSMCVVMFADRFIGDPHLISKRDLQLDQGFQKAMCVFYRNKQKTLKLNPSRRLNETQEHLCVIS